MTATVREVTPEPPELEDVLEAIAASARDLDVEVYLVGGFVRDRLLGGAQGKDIDLVTVGADPMPLLAGVASRFGWHPPERFERFGTAQVRGGAYIVEGVRARAERYDPESRNPDVRPGTLVEDIWRRDFTVNALCQGLDGEVIDITGKGIADLVAGVLRTPLDPAETFAEDPLRMFRAARFVARLGFTLAPGTIEAMRPQAPRTSILSVERVTDEIRRMLVAPYPSAGIEVLREAGLLDLVLPELVAAIGVDQGGYHTHDVYGHTVATVDLAPADLVTRTAALLHDIAKPPTHAIAADGRHTFYDHPQIGADMARAILTRWRYSNDEISDVSRLVRLHLRPIQYDREFLRRRGGAQADQGCRAAPRQDARPRSSGHEGVRVPDDRGARRAGRPHGPARRRWCGIGHGGPPERRRAHGPGRARAGPVGGTGKGGDP